MDMYSNEYKKKKDLEMSEKILTFVSVIKQQETKVITKRQNHYGKQIQL